MANNKPWGHCQHCRFFDSPAQAPLGTEEARCRQPQHAQFDLIVFGACGCTAFELRAGLPADVEQPGLQP